MSNGGGRRKNLVFSANLGGSVGWRTALLAGIATVHIILQITVSWAISVLATIKVIGILPSACW